MAGVRWVCLMYHDVTPGLSVPGGAPGRFAVTHEEFRRHLDQLRSEARGAHSLRHMLGEHPAGGVAVTFDDGNAGQYERGFRELADRDMSATFFVTTRWVGTPGYVSWGQLREMRAAGMDIQSHTQSHPFMSELPAQEVRRELRESKAELDQHLVQDTDMLALPGGDWPRSSYRGLIAEAGYRVIATSQWGVNRGLQAGNDLTIVHRCTVSGVTSRSSFQKIVDGDPWLARRRRIREGGLRTLRSALGPSRYAHLRKVFLGLVRP